MLIADTNAETARTAVEKLKGYGYKSHFTQCDVSRGEGVRDMVNLAVREMGGIDILCPVNHAS